MRGALKVEEIMGGGEKDLPGRGGCILSSKMYLKTKTTATKRKHFFSCRLSHYDCLFPSFVRVLDVPYLILIFVIFKSFCVAVIDFRPISPKISFINQQNAITHVGF